MSSAFLWYDPFISVSQEESLQVIASLYQTLHFVTLSIVEIIKCVVNSNNLIYRIVFFKGALYYFSDQWHYKFNS